MLLAVVAIKTVRITRLATIVNARIYVIWKALAVRMPCANLKIIAPHANVQLDLKEIQHLSRGAFAYQLRVYQPINVLVAICVLPINVMYHAQIQNHVPLASVVPIINAPKCATQTTTACRVRFATIVEHVNQDVIVTQIAPHQKYVLMENVNVGVVLLERHLDVLISMNAPKVPAIRVLGVITFRDHIVVRVPNKQLVTHTQHQAVQSQINAREALTVLKILNVHKENVPIHVTPENVDGTQFVNRSIMVLSVNVHLETLVTRLINPLDVSVLNAFRVTIVMLTNSAIPSQINVIVSRLFP